MTSLQIQTAENYLLRIAELKKKTTTDGNELFKQCNELEREILSSNIGYKWCYTSSSEFAKDPFKFDGLRDDIRVDEVVSCLTRMQNNLQGLLNALPYYQEYCSVRADIERASHTVTADMDDFIKEMVIKYSGRIDFGKLLLEYAKEDVHFMRPTDAYFDGLVQKLKLYLQDITTEKKSKSTKTQPSTTINLSQIATQNQTNNQTVTVSFEDCFKSLDDCETLSEDEISDIKKELEDIKNLLADKKGKKKSIRERIGKVLRFIADKGTDVMMALLPLITNLLQQI